MGEPEAAPAKGSQRWYFYIMKDAHPIRNDSGEARDFAGSHSGASPKSRKGTIVFTNENIDGKDWFEDSTCVWKSRKSIGFHRDRYHWNANICPEPWQVDLLLGERIDYRKQHPCGVLRFGAPSIILPKGRHCQDGATFSFHLMARDSILLLVLLLLQLFLLLRPYAKEESIICKGGRRERRTTYWQMPSFGVTSFDHHYS
jgi:hypothetical protein